MGKKVGNTHFTDKGYENFVTLSKEEQIETIKPGYSPVNMKKIEEALKNVPNGNKSSRNVAKAQQGNGASDKGTGTKADTKRPEADTSES